jgi:hypothetical protein
MELLAPCVIPGALFLADDGYIKLTFIPRLNFHSFGVF